MAVWISLREFCARYSISGATGKHYLQLGLIPSFKLPGGQLRVLDTTPDVVNMMLDKDYRLNNTPLYTSADVIELLNLPDSYRLARVTHRHYLHHIKPRNIPKFGTRYTLLQVLRLGELLKNQIPRTNARSKGGEEIKAYYFLDWGEEELAKLAVSAAKEQPQKKEQQE